MGDMYGNPTYEELVGIPEEVVEDGRWVGWMPELVVLKATCLAGWHDCPVGEPFRWRDESVRLSATQEVSYNTWRRFHHKFSRTWMLRCPKCGKDTRHAAAGHMTVNEAKEWRTKHGV